MNRVSAVKIRKRKAGALITVIFFSFSFALFPVPVFASNVSQQTPSPSVNPLVSTIDLVNIPTDAVQLNTGSGETSTQVLLDAENMDRIYLLQETRRGEVTTLRYVYDDILGTVTILWSSGREGDEVRPAYYSRYLLGPNDSLDLLLEEGWVKDGSLAPFKLYENSRGKMFIRVFDRSGKLLRLESGKGTIREFLYTQNAQLLAIRSVSGSGNSSFVDLITALFHDIQTPVPSHYAEILAVLQNSEKRLQSLNPERSVIDPKVVPGFRESLNLNENHWYLAWMESAHPMRAGPEGGV